MSAEVIDFLRVLHEDAEGKIEIRLIADTKDREQSLPIVRRWFTPDALAAKLPEITAFAEASGYAVFFGVLPRTNDGGTAQDVAPARVLWCDLDYKDVFEVEAWRRIDGFPVPPSIVVCSGRGLHLYWRLQEPESPHYLAGICRRIAYALGGDKCYDPARILRLPGSRNLKACWSAAGFQFDAARAPKVEIRRYEPARCAQPFDFDDLADPPAPEASREKVKRESKEIGATLPATVRRLLDRSPRLAALWRSEGKAHGDTSGSGYDLSFACHLVNMGIRNVDDLDAAVSARPRTGESKPASMRSIKRTVERALSLVPEPPPPDMPPEGPPPEDCEPPPEPEANDRRPRIVVNAERLGLTHKCWAATLATNTPPRIFQRAGEVVTVRFAPDAPSEIRSFGVADITGAAMRSARFIFEKISKEGVVTRSPADPPKLIMADMLAYPDPGLPVIDAIVRCPVLDKHGRMVSHPGYDASGLYYDPPEGFVLPPIPTDAESVTLARKVILKDWLGEFPFASETDKAHALALLILPFVRRMIDGPTPLHIIEASERGTGKSLLAEVLCAPALGRFPAGSPLSPNEEEVRKKLTATLVARPQVVFFDNLDGRVDSPSLCIALTSPTWEDRILGVSANAAPKVDCAWLATANNAELSTDLARRSIRCRLDRGTERPWEYRAARELRPWTMANRHLLAAAALTLCASWVAAGAKPGTGTLGSFEAWAKVVGGVLDHANQTGFLANVREVYDQADPVQMEWRQLVVEWWHAHGAATTTSGQLVTLADEHALLASVLSSAVTARSKATRIGRGLQRQRGRIFSGLRVTSRLDAHINATVWALEVAEEAAVPTRRAVPPPAQNDPSTWRGRTEYD